MQWHTFSCMQALLKNNPSEMIITNKGYSCAESSTVFPLKTEIFRLKCGVTHKEGVGGTAWCF